MAPSDWSPFSWGEAYGGAGESRLKTWDGSTHGRARTHKGLESREVRFRGVLHAWCRQEVWRHEKPRTGTTLLHSCPCWNLEASSPGEMLRNSRPGRLVRSVASELVSLAVRVAAVHQDMRVRCSSL